MDLVVRSHLLPESEVHGRVTPVLRQTAAGIVSAKLAGHCRDGWMHPGATFGLFTPAGNRRAHSGSTAGE